MSPRAATAGGWLALVGAIVGLGLMGWMAGRLLLWHLPEHITHASALPAGLVEDRFEVFGDADMEALRKGRCRHGPIRVTPYPDGGALLTCSFPVGSGPVSTFAVASLSPEGVTGMIRQGTH